MMGSETLNSTSEINKPAFLTPSASFKLAFTMLVAVGFGCTPGEQAADSALTFSTTRYAPQNRPDVRGMQGAVSSDHPLATQAGLRVLHEGGNATDAIIAMAGVLAVVRPHMNGIGGDAFGIFYNGETREVTALNASGRAGELATPEFFQAADLNQIPGTGALSVSVPGAVAGWVDAHARYGTKDFQSLLEPAVNYARNGFAVSVRLAMDFEEQGGSLNQAGHNLYLPGAAAPQVGSLLINKALAVSLETVAREGKAGYYNGAIGEQLAAFVAELGGHLRANDFANHTSTWVDPLQGDYLGYRFLAMPPNSQGVTQLALMEMAKYHPLESLGLNSAEYLHTLIELKKLAFADRDQWVADPEHAVVPVAALLDADYLRERSSLVNSAQAEKSVESGFDNLDFTNPDKNRDDAGDTVYLTAVDQWGNAVSWIQSNFSGFGSGLLESQTGILLQIVVHRTHSSPDTII